MDVENEITVSQEEDMATEVMWTVRLNMTAPVVNLHQQLHYIRLENIKLKSENENF